MAGLDFSIVVGGNNISSYVAHFERSHDICQGTGGFNINLSSNFPHSPNPFDTVTIQEHGNTVFTGYVDAFTKIIEPAACKLEGTDVLKRARDYFISESYISQGQTITYWMEFFLELCGLTSHNVESTIDVVPLDTEFRFEYILDILKKLCSTQGWVYYADANGIIHVGDLMQVGNPVFAAMEGANLISILRQIDDSWVRSKVIVWGEGDVIGVAEDTTNPFLGSGEARIAALHSLSFATNSAAEDFAEELLEEFYYPLDLKTCEVISDIDCPSIGDTIVVQESFTGLSHLALVTGLTTRMSPDGAIVLIYLDGKCPAYWGWGLGEDLHKYPQYYCSLDDAGFGGAGVYKRTGYYWYPVNSGLFGDELLTHAVQVAPWNHLEVWRVSRGGVHKSSNGGRSWTKILLGNPTPACGYSPPIQETYLDCMDVGFDRFNIGTVYVLATTKAPPRRAWLYKTSDGGNSWVSIQIRRYALF